jgi:prepilin-type N-terminal cleavage/methylation domain-containing protein
MNGLNKKIAFSLTELLIVIAIVAIIAAYAVPTYRSYANRTKVSQLIEALTTCQLAVASYYNDQYSFPTTIDCFGGVAQNTTVAIPGFAGSFYFTTGTTTYATPKLYMQIWRNDLLAPTGINPGKVSFGMYVKDNVIYTNCGTWNNSTATDVDPDLLPAGCRDQISSTAWVQ